MDYYDISKHLTFKRHDDVIVSKWTEDTPKVYKPYGFDFTFDINRGTYKVCVYRGEKVLIEHESEMPFERLLQATIGRLEIIIEREADKIEHEKKLVKEHDKEIDRMLRSAMSMTGDNTPERIDVDGADEVYKESIREGE